MDITERIVCVNSFEADIVQRILIGSGYEWACSKKTCRLFREKEYPIALSFWNNQRIKYAPNTLGFNSITFGEFITKLEREL